MSNSVDLAAEYVLLVLDDDKGGFRQDLTTVDFTVAAAELACLVRDDVLAFDSSREGLPFLCAGHRAARDELHEEIVHRCLGKTCDQAIAALASPFGKQPHTARSLREHVVERLVGSGVLTTRRDRLLGIIPRTRYPQADGVPEVELRGRLMSVFNGAEPDEDTGVLIALLDAGHALSQAFPGLTRDQLRRGHEIAEGRWPGEGLRRAFAQQAAYMAQTSTIGVSY
ncbi:Golgi phosphoprotein 3 (GPP34) [Propionibacterium cyclohexanicum]|uniref:Golgi phosphoprotein 3 (GPP34) n=1 Tax=Propionibacterium cyclohexanicum TaxID=64702 RepID=A0A1H9SEF2_9ACTN|nr:GPP34 family phosphoprotein [Propionibacterium cyclohexanicum]SER83392.1 Golgi phosphoprotein 3 (GPP34) [Propionibacterium cyclohexanicum]